MYEENIFCCTIFVLIAGSVLAQWNDCPYGEVNCDGQCGRFVDTDNDGYCDHSQPAPEDRVDANIVTSINIKQGYNQGVVDSFRYDPIRGQELKIKTVKQVADVYKINAQNFADVLSDFYKVTIKSTDNFQLLHDNYGLEPSVVKDIALGLSLDNSALIEEAKEKSSKERKYIFFPVAIFLIILYTITHILSRKNIISVVNHRKFWNILLLITFLGVGLSGIFLVLRINFGLNIRWPFNLLYWHVEIGLAMTLISIFHTLWHWPYYKNMVKFNRKKNNNINN